MNARERFHAVMNFEPVDRTLMWEFGYWSGTVRRWYKEGLPKREGVPDDLPDGKSTKGPDVSAYFGLDPRMSGFDFETLMWPLFKEEVLEDHGDWILMRDKWGMIIKQRKDRTTLPHYVSGPVASRDDWERLKAERLQPRLEGRLPDDWDVLKANLEKRDYPLSLGGYVGFFGVPRFLMGVEPLLVAFREQPDLIKDMINYFCEFYMAIYDELLDLIEVDVALIWEDMCYKTGPLISPAMFSEFMLPSYKKFTSFLRSRGIKHIIVDTDGKCWLLLPLFVEGGVTGVYPFEVNAGMDVVDVRKAFPKLQMLGGIDKMRLMTTPQAMDEELQYKIPFMLKSGGYIPTIDHNVPPDVPWINFKHYRSRLNEMICSPATYR